MANPSYKTKYTELLKQHLALIGHLNEALSTQTELKRELDHVYTLNNSLNEQVSKLQAAAIKHIESQAAQGQKELAKAQPKPK